jgi:retron-type reverse transcriptase
MRRVNNLWNHLTSFPNLVRAAEKASRGKRSFPNVAQFLFDLENQLCRLQDELRSKQYRPGPYRTFQICEPKPRMISAAPFRDRVVHHALCRVLEPIYERSFIFDSYACRRRKGTHAAVNRLTHFARANKYVLKCDIRRCFPSVDHEILKARVARKIKDRDVLWLVNTIVDHSNPQEPVCDWFPGDGLFTPAERRRGLPIGNQTSQFFANVYLDPFDHFVQEQLHCGYYIRYVDDFVILGNDKNRLAEVRTRCREYLAGLRLRLHPRKSEISRVADGTNFLGYRLFPDHRRLARSNVVRMQRRLRGLQKRYANGRICAADIHRRLMSWIGHAQHADSYRLRERLFSQITFVRKA